MTTYSVGQPYNPARTEWPEAAQYNYRSGGHELLLFWRSPGGRDVKAVKTSPIELGLLPGKNAIFLLYRVSGACGWSDAPFSVHLVPELERVAPPAPAPAERALLHVLLIDAATGIVKAIRVTSMSPEFTAALHETISAQLSTEWSLAEHDREIAAAYRRWPSCDDMARAALIRETAGAI
jgi:hypothetical protein